MIEVLASAPPKPPNIGRQCSGCGVDLICCADMRSAAEDTALGIRAIGLVDRVYESREALAAGVHEIASAIAAKSPLAIRGIKEVLNYARDHSVADGLNQVATWNAAMLMSEDLMAAMAAGQQGKAPRFRD